MSREGFEPLSGFYYYQDISQTYCPSDYSFIRWQDLQTHTKDYKKVDKMLAALIDVYMPIADFPFDFHHDNK